MSDFVWSIENVQTKPNSSFGATGKLVCSQDGGPLGWCFIEGWLYGCALGGLSNLSSLQDIHVDAFPSLVNFLKECPGTLNNTNNPDLPSYYNQYKPKRFMFTVGGYWLSPILKKMIENSTLVTTFENWSHHSAPNKMYFLNVKEL